jgi:hypothetical protein
MGKPEGKRPLGIHRQRWEDNIELDLREIVWGGMDWIDLTDGRNWYRVLMNSVVNLQVL